MWIFGSTLVVLLDLLGENLLVISWLEVVTNLIRRLAMRSGSKE